MPYIPVARLEEIPERSGKVVDLGALEVALFRLDGAVYATSNVCPHQGASLAEGEVRGGTVICPWHRWCFNVKDGTSPLNPKLRISTYPVKQEGDQLFILVPEEAAAARLS